MVIGIVGIIGFKGGIKEGYFIGIRGIVIVGIIGVKLGIIGRIIGVIGLIGVKEGNVESVLFLSLFGFWIVEEIFGNFRVNFLYLKNCFLFIWNGNYMLFLYGVCLGYVFIVFVENGMYIGYLWLYLGWFVVSCG